MRDTYYTVIRAPVSSIHPKAASVIDIRPYMIRDHAVPRASNLGHPRYRLPDPETGRRSLKEHIVYRWIAILLVLCGGVEARNDE
jgi:hypothetical protein